MSNPYLPEWEYIPDGEPRVFGDRIYVYGSHDRVASDEFCDYKLKVWSAPLSNPGQWVCHGHCFHTAPDRDHPTDTDWSDHCLYAPDVVEKDGKYYLYAYILNDKGCVAVADKPEGPFKLLSTYKYGMPEEVCANGIFIDPGVLVDDDGRVYIYCGFTRSFMAEINADNMYEVIEGTHIEHIIPKLPQEDESGFFEACSPRKIGDTYYLIYSPNYGSRLAYSTSDSPCGPFTYRGYIVDNSQNYPGGNNHGSVCLINGQWYIFYHRMTNGTIMSRRGCVERINILPDGSIPPVEMTSLGFEESLNPYQIQPAEIACYLTGDCLITEHDIFSRVITNIKNNCVMGYKYYDFGDDFVTKTMKFAAKVRGAGCNATLDIYIDDPEKGTHIGSCNIGLSDGTYTCNVSAVTGRHAVYLIAKETVKGPFVCMFENRNLFELEEFVFMK